MLKKSTLAELKPQDPKSEKERTLCKQAEFLFKGMELKKCTQKWSILLYLV
jgi:hypothetical protein